MGYRINKAMGWGMPIEQFDQLYTGIRSEYGLEDSIDHIFSTLTDKDLTVDDVYRSLSNNNQQTFPILQPRLLATNNGDGYPIGNATDLYVFVSTPDKITDIIFFPTLYHRSKWHRWDDEMDYAFECNRDENDYEPRDFTTYTKYGHYPWTNDITDLNGNKIKWETHFKTNDWIPSVPAEIQWYLTQFGVFNPRDVYQLRPVIAQWWS